MRQNTATKYESAQDESTNHEYIKAAAALRAQVIELHPAKEDVLQPTYVACDFEAFLSLYGEGAASDFA
jgi:hypothetical protein